MNTKIPYSVEAIKYACLWEMLPYVYTLGVKDAALLEYMGHNFPEELAYFRRKARHHSPAAIGNYVNAKSGEWIAGAYYEQP